jgi:hypothetical protein
MLKYSGMLRTSKCRIVDYIFDRNTVPIFLTPSTYFSFGDVGSMYQTVWLCGRRCELPVSFSSTQQFVLHSYDCPRVER